MTSSPTRTARPGWQVAVERGDARAVVDLDHDRAVGDPPRDRHPAGSDRADRGVQRCREVEPVVEVRVADASIAARGLEDEGGRAEALRDPGARDRPNDRRGAVAVAGGPAHDQGRVPVGRVVAVEGALPVARGAVALQVRRGRGDRVGGIADVRMGDARELWRRGRTCG